MIKVIVVDSSVKCVFNILPLCALGRFSIGPGGGLILVNPLVSLVNAVRRFVVLPAVRSNIALIHTKSQLIVMESGNGK